jgi:5-methyltetrahydropteroyltriglutamate--homocysteine methyltransferase
MAGRTRAPFRADHVGSLLRPKSLLDLREKAARGEVDAATLRAHENACIDAVVAMQEGLGLEGITDGEYRRESFHGDFIGRLEGVEFKLFSPPGSSSAGPTAGRDLDASTAAAPETPVPKPRENAPFAAVVSARIALPKGGIEVENFRYLESRTRRTAKQTIPSPTMTHFRGGRAAIDETAYPEMSEFFADLARVYREEVAGLAAAGCRYLQLDDTNLAYLCDENMRAGAAARGEDVERLPRDYAQLINESLRGRPEEMSVCVHLCRGNARSRWFAQGGYEPVADVVFNELEVDGFFLEYDDERSGDFAPLRFVPKGKTIVLGLVTSKRGELEDADAIARRIDEAARFIDIGQLCLSPQCGFASAVGGNLLTEDDEKRKLELVVSVASRVWGQI